MKPIDILYTPLDVPPPPSYDYNDIKRWIKNTGDSTNKIKDFFQKNKISAEDGFQNYPWDLSYAYVNLFDTGPGWINNFNKEFPEICDWILNSFDIQEEDLGLIMFLPLKDNYSGYGFWHRDVDPLGLRWYVEFEKYNEDKLFVKQTKLPYNNYNQISLQPEVSDNEHKQLFRNQEIECKIKTRNQAFYINNIRAIHRTFTAEKNVGKTRMAVAIGGKFKNDMKFNKSLDDLIVRSAEKFKDYAILWDG